MDDLGVMWNNPGAALGGAATGAGHGATMVANAATGGLITPLNDHVNDLILQNGGAYAAANIAANIGVAAATAVLPCGLAANVFRGINGAAGARDLLDAVQAGDGVKAGFAFMAIISAMMGTGRCFVAGTPVAVGWNYEPIYVGQSSETAATIGDGEINVGWMIAGLAIVVTTVRVRRKNADEERERRQAGRLIFAEGKFCAEPADEPEEDEPVASEPDPSHNYLSETSVMAAAATTRDTRTIPRSPRARSRGPSAISKLLWCLPFLVAGLCFWKALPSAGTPGPSIAAASGATPAAARVRQAQKRTLVTRPIEQIQVGQRVLAENPELRGQALPQPDIDPETSRLVVLHQLKPDGDDVTIETLFSLEQLLAVAIDRLEFDVSDVSVAVLPRPLVGTTEEVSLSELLVGQAIDLNIAELGVDGPAEIVGIHPCPPIEPDDGTGRRLVTSVFRHSVANVVDVCTTASDESIGTTSNHPFWSEDRQAFIPAGDLRPGENLRRADGTLAQVTRITPRRGDPVPVFNFEVDGQHVYSVGLNGILAHNACGNIPNCEDFARDMLKARPNGVMMEIYRKTNLLRYVGKLPGYPNNAAYWNHFFHLEGNILRDAANQTGVAWHHWLEMYMKANKLDLRTIGAHIGIRLVH